jgi:hypothetical protein
MTESNITEQFAAIQRMMPPPAAFSGALGHNARYFWEAQNQILDGMEHLAHDWFERRHVGTQAALEAAQRCCQAETTVDLVREYQDWAAGAVQRLMADGLDWQQQSMAIANALVRSSLPPNGDGEPQATPMPAETPLHARAA